MSEPIPAGSLASVVDLADNPPKQPLLGLTSDLQRPLVLYIARVPGLHDVFLTTMKPQQKVVTAQDVQSSLYYLHLDRPEDHEFLDYVDDSNDLSDDEDEYGKPANMSSIGGVRRKPLPQSPMLGSDKRLEPLPEALSYLQTFSTGTTGSLRPKRKPVSQDSAAEHRRTDLKPPLPDRKLLGPRPMDQYFLSGDNPPLQDVPEKHKTDLRRRSEQSGGTRPGLPPRPLSGSKDSAPMTPPRPLHARLEGSSVANGGHSRFPHRKPITQPASYDPNGTSHVEIRDGVKDQEINELSLSLIRRYNNEQWNVGKISSKGTKTAINGETSREISIKILTQGYVRFVNPIDLFAKHAGTVWGKPNGPHDSHTPVTSAEERPLFQRHLQISGHALDRKQRHGPEESDSSFTYRGTRPSSDSTDSYRSVTNGSPELMSGSKKAHVLRSPWGICEFTTGVAGRSFKCKHSYTSSDARSSREMHSAQVSELRFNLPSSKTLRSTGSKNLVPGSPREARRSSLFLHQRRRRSSSSFEGLSRHGAGYFGPKVELEERLDLSLGQEHAGGGFGGKQAKMGKLIIEKEGLQMLDLIVAANMALWWQVYERFT